MPLITKHFYKSFTALSLLYGLISAILMALLTLIFYYATGSGNTPVIMWNYLLFAATMFLGVRAYQQEIVKDVISYKQAYISGVFIGISAAFFFAVFMISYSKFIDVEFIQNFITVNSAKMGKSIKNEELTRQIQYITPVTIGFYAFGQLLLMSLFLPLLIFVFFKHKKK